ncbi:MAG: hypothetical protein VKI83_01070 [Synechococcaceae cyanobacterium]|nr:hypothetical protein [Synechococcaceae cyanobacterium]
MATSSSCTGNLRARGGARVYRLVDACCQPHPQLDGVYESIDEAVCDAIGWLESLEPDGCQSAIGLDVRAANGDWRTIRKPAQLLCPLAQHRRMAFASAG